jgi:tetraacyldisaccharide 4'-kinase
MPCWRVSHLGSIALPAMLHAPDFWKRTGLVSDLLLPFGWAYAALGELRREFTKPYKASVPVICIGNLVAGGAGKTPVALSLAKLFTDAGMTPHILSRGYGGSLRGPTRVELAIHGAAETGDEPLLLARAAPVWIGANRVASAKAAIKRGADILLLDDGFQNPSLHQDLGLIVIDGGYGIGNGRVIPAGPLREPVAAALMRASAIVMMGDDPSRSAPRDKPMLRARLAPRDAVELKNQRVVAFAGIGRPAKFFATMREIGTVVIATHDFPDHHAYSAAELARLGVEAHSVDAMLVTTEKDWVRLPPSWRNRIRAVKVEVEWQDRAALDALLAPIMGGRLG